jgi:hypothetical protein
MRVKISSVRAARSVLPWSHSAAQVKSETVRYLETAS